MDNSVNVLEWPRALNPIIDSILYPPIKPPLFYR